MTRVKVSIIVPVYNVENYVEECFQSIARQTYAGPMECIFVDDCGTDRSVALVEELMAAYRGAIAFKMLHHERNRGLSAARNTGLREASGDYVYFIDSDDSITPECLALLSALAKKYPGVDMVQGNNKTNLQFLRMKSGLLPEYTDNKKWIKECLLTRQIPVTAWNRLVRRNFLVVNGLFFEEGLIHEDELWTFLLSKHLQKLAFCFEDTYFYRENPSGIMSFAGKDYKSLAPIVSLMASNLEKPQIFLEVRYMINLIPESLFNDDEFMLKLCGINNIVLRWYKIIRDLRSTTIWSLRGLLARVQYNIMPVFYKHDIFY